MAASSSALLSSSSSISKTDSSLSFCQRYADAISASSISSSSFSICLSTHNILRSLTEPTPSIPREAMLSSVSSGIMVLVILSTVPVIFAPSASSLNSSPFLRPTSLASRSLLKNPLPTIRVIPFLLNLGVSDAQVRTIMSPASTVSPSIFLP